jgi:hypothetical protein
MLAKQLLGNSYLSEIGFFLARRDNCCTKTAQLGHHFRTKKSIASGNYDRAICPVGKRCG